MKDESNQLKEEFTDDGLHLTESAYNLWRDELVKLIS